MNLNIKLRNFLLREKASVRLVNVLIGHYGLRLNFTLAQFIREWPLERLRKECFGFGPKAQAELLEILERQPNSGNRRFMTYVASLRPPEPERTCVYCGCTDSRACAGGCSWVITWQFGNVGVCSNCIAPHQPFQQAIEPLRLKTFVVELGTVDSKKHLTIWEPKLTTPRFDCAEEFMSKNHNRHRRLLEVIQASAPGGSR